MTDRVTPAWLAEFQASFGAMLRTPLDRSRGTLRPCPEEYPRELALIAGAERLAVYNRQYWFRLFGILAGAFPLTARLLGHWRFNGHAARFLVEHPPRDWSIDRVPEGFATFLATTTSAADVRELRLEHPALIEAARIDDGWRVAHYASLPPTWRLTPSDAPRLFSSRLQPSPAVLLIEESWPLVDLRGRLVEDDGEDAVSLPPRLAAPRAWAIVRRPNGVGALPLEPLENRLFTLLREHRVDTALAELEETCAATDRASLPQRARLWLMRSVELGFWTGLEDAPPVSAQ